jgi:hypothetical protein
MTAEDSHDHPLNCHWRPVRPDAYDRLGLPPARSEAAALARAQILTEAFVIGRSDPRAWLSYSRRRQFYTARRGRYWPPTYTFDFVVTAIDQLADLGLLDHERMPRGNLGRQSRFKAAAELMRLLNDPPRFKHDPTERIILRAKDGSLADYKESERTLQLRCNVDEINEALQSTEIGLRSRVVREGDHLQVGITSIGAASNLLHRVFNRSSFGLGGRFYGAWWQNIPSASRARISISGVDTLESDFPYLHPALLYLEAGVPMRGDPYDLVDWPRKTAKIAFNTLVNADTRQSAVRSIASNAIGGEGAYAKALTLVRELEARHPSIAPNFGNATGLRLMRRDSDITEFLALRLARKGIVSLPIHDSYIVRDRRTDKGELLEAMAEALWRVARNSGALSNGYHKNIPQYGGGCDGGGWAARGGGQKGGDGQIGSGICGVVDLGVVAARNEEPSAAAPSVDGSGSKALAERIVIVFPEERQRDLFGADRLNVPYQEILGWRGGIALPGVQKALRREMRRRGLRHLDLADRVGVSRSHLENIMDGRRGASSLVASRLRDFLVDGAKTVGMAA